MELQYAVSLWNYLHYQNVANLDQLLECLRKYNYGIELWNSWRVPLNLFDRQARNELKSMLNGMPVSLHSEIGLTGSDFHRKQIDAAAELGASVLVLHSDNLYLPNTGLLDIDLANEIVEYARTCDVQLALENGQLPFLVDAISQVPGLKICLDIGHIYLTSEPLHKFLDALKEQVVHLHIQEIMSQPETALLGEEDIILDHYTPGTGGIPKHDWTLLFETLKQIEYKGLAVFEIQPRNPLQTAFLGKAFIQEFL